MRNKLYNVKFKRKIKANLCPLQRAQQIFGYIRVQTVHLEVWGSV